MPEKTASTKLVRLRRLQRRATNVPATYWSFGEFIREAPAEGSWCVRACSVSDLVLPYGVTKSNIETLAATVEPDVFVVQEFLEPKASGVSAICQGGILNEAIAGPCSPILRHGGRGWRWGTNRLGELQWDSGVPVLRESLPEVVNVETGRVGFTQNECVAEWIQTADGTFYWVDLKILPRPYLVGCFKEPPKFYAFNPAQKRTETKLISSTDLTYARDLTEGAHLDWHAMAGSPLSHLSLLAFESRISLTVLESP
jgi:hypothetical protein